VAQGRSAQIQIRVTTVLLVLLALAFFALAVYYVVTPAGSLLSFLPGHDAGSTHHHVKHGIVAAALGLLALIGAWFTTAQRKDRSTKAD
jgi:hypothetical protein